MKNQKNAYTRIMGVDVGGSHVTAGIIENAEVVSICRRNLNSKDSATNIIDCISGCIHDAAGSNNATQLIGIAFPGPFNYAEGISEIAGVGGKFNKTFGVHIGQALTDACHNSSVWFFNDAHCFAAGANIRYELKGKRKLFLTLGTGLGAAFMEKNELLEQHSLIPASAALYDQPFGDSIADEYFSTRWILKEYKRCAGKEISSVKELATGRTAAAEAVFRMLGLNLAAFLDPWIEKFEVEELVIGGNIAKAHDLFGPHLFGILNKKGRKITIIYSDHTEECILHGAAELALKSDQFQQKHHREITSFPDTTLFGAANFMAVDSMEFLHCVCDQKTVLLRGEQVTNWNYVRRKMAQQLSYSGKKILWYALDVCFAEESDKPEIDGPGSAIYYDEEKIQLLIPDSVSDINIIYGSDPEQSKWNGLLMDVFISGEHVLCSVVSSATEVDLDQNENMVR